jgi:hypothetical protein
MKESTKNTLKMPLIWLAVMLVLLLIQVIGDIYIANEIVETPVYYCTFIWIAYAWLSAQFEAYYFNYAEKDNAEKPNLHKLLTVIRFVVIIPIWILTSWKAVLCYMAIFPFFHDGSYYTTREIIFKGTYPKKWFAQSITSTALSTKFFTPVVRTILAIISIIMIILLRYKTV